MTLTRLPTLCFAGCQTVKQESLANVKVSARQPWYIGHNSLNHLHSSQSTVNNKQFRSPKNVNYHKVPRKFELMAPSSMTMESTLDDLELL